MPPGHDTSGRRLFAAGLARRAPVAGEGRGGYGDPPRDKRKDPPRDTEKSRPRGVTPWGTPPSFAPPSAEAVATVKEIYAEVEASLGPAADACRACGRCCRFRPGGIVLFASSLEMAVLVADAGPPDASRFVVGGPVAGNWVCPYQEGKRCTARPVRALGCRTYFCEASAAARGRAVHADALDRLRAVAREHGHPWWYGPAKAYLDAVVSVR
jgi:hypothetical protein